MDSSLTSIALSKSAKEITYMQLPEPFKKERDNAYELRSQCRQVIDEISRSDLKVANSALQRAKNDCVFIKTKHDVIIQKANNLRKEARESFQDTRRFGTWGIQQIANKSGPAVSEKLPIELYDKTLLRLGLRL